MNYKKIKYIGAKLTVCMLLLGAVSSPNMTVHATSQSEEATNEIDRVLTEETTELIKSAVEQQGTKKTASQTRWNRGEGDTSVTRQTYIGSGTTKIEIFYSSNVESPKVLLQAPSKKVYRPGTTTAYEDTLIVYRKGYIVTDYPDIKYDILYVSETQDPGMWDIAFTVDENIDEFVVITARAADNWQNFHTDYKTAPTDIIVWEMSNTSDYTANDVTSIVAKDENIPTNHITETVVIEQEKASPIFITVIIVILFIILGTVTAIIAVNRANKEKNLAKSSAIKNANKRLRLKRMKENETLDKILEAYENQYNDDDYFASFSEKKKPADAEKVETKQDKPEHNPLPRVQTNIKNGHGTVKTTDQNNTNSQNSAPVKDVTRTAPKRAVPVNGNDKANGNNKNNTENKNEPIRTQNGQTQVRGVRGEEGMERYANKDINRSREKILSASPTIPETNPFHGEKKPLQNMIPTIPQTIKPSWMVAAEKTQKIYNSGDEPADFF